MIKLISTELNISEAFKEDINRNVARVNRETISEMNLKIGGIIHIQNGVNDKFTAAFIFPSSEKDIRTIRIDKLLRRNLQASIGDPVIIRKTADYLAQQIFFAGLSSSIIINNANFLAEKLENRIVSKGDILSFRVNNSKMDLMVINHTPQNNVVKIHKDTRMFCQKMKFRKRISNFLFK